jgi:hypothetical protein
MLFSLCCTVRRKRLAKPLQQRLSATGAEQAKAQFPTREKLGMTHTSPDFSF